MDCRVCCPITQSNFPNIMSISYRKLVSGDSLQYREIRLHSLKTQPESFGSTFAAQSILPQLMFERALEQPVDHRFVIGAFDQIQLLGICGFLPFAQDHHRKLNNTGTLVQLYLRPAFRGKGVGLELVRATLHQAFICRSIDQVILGVKSANNSAIRVYQDAGFISYNSSLAHGEIDDDDLQMMIIHRKNFFPYS